MKTGRRFNLSDAANAKRHRDKQAKEDAKRYSPVVNKCSLGALKAKKKPDYSKIGQVKYSKGMGSGFYLTAEWRKLRFEVISERRIQTGGIASCVICGASMQDGIKIHVDHILPRSKFPQLELVKSNLQVLCEPCNVGKGASYKTVKSGHLSVKG